MHMFVYVDCVWNACEMKWIEISYYSGYYKWFTVFFKNFNANQLIICTFGYLNGIEIDLLISLIRWKDINENRKRKIKALYKDFETKPEYRERYYSFNVGHKLVMFLNGDILKFGQRIVVKAWLIALTFLMYGKFHLQILA